MKTSEYRTAMENAETLMKLEEVVARAADDIDVSPKTFMLLLTTYSERRRELQVIERPRKRE